MIRLGGEPTIQSLLEVFAKTMREQVEDVSSWWFPSNTQVVELARMWGRTLERLKAASDAEEPKPWRMAYAEHMAPRQEGAEEGGGA